MAGSLDLGNLYAKLAIDYSDLHKAELSAKNFGDNTRKELAKISQVGESLKSTGKTLTAAVTIPLLGAGAASVKMATDFNKAVREVNSLLDPKDQDFEGLKKDIRGVSLALGTDLVESAQAAYEALGAGVPKDNLIDFLTVASKAAIGGVTTTKVAVDGMTSVTNAWGESAGSAGEIADVMFQAVKYGKVTFDQFASSISLVSGIAKEMGVSFKEVAAYSALATSKGEKQTTSMTQMRQAIAALMGPNEKMKKVFEKLNITNAKGIVESKGLAGAYKIIRDEATKMGVPILDAVGSVDALQYVLRSTGENADEAAMSLDRMGKASGANEAAFKELDKARGFDKLVNNLKSLATIIGDQLLPIIVPMVESFAQWLSQANALDPGLVRIGVSLAALAAAAGPILLIVGTLLTSLPKIGAALTALGFSVPVLGVLAGLGLLIYKNWEPLTKFFEEFKTRNEPNIESIKGSFRSLSDELGKDGKTISDFFSNLNFNSSGEDSKIFANSWAEAADGVLAAIELMVEGFEWLWTALKNDGYAIVEFLDKQWQFLNKSGAEIAEAFYIVGEEIGTFADSVINDLKNLPSNVKAIFDEIILKIKEINWIDEGVRLGADMMIGLKNGIVSHAQGVSDAVKSALGFTEKAAKEKLDSHSPSLVYMALGKDMMDGLGIGITNNAGMPKDALTSAIAGINQSVILNPTFGINDDFSKYDLELEKEKAYYQQSLELLQQAEEQKIASIQPYAALREQMAEQHSTKIANIEKQKQDATLAGYSNFFNGLASMSRSENKKLAAIGKAAAVAQATIDMYSAISSAFAKGNAAGGIYTGVAWAAAAGVTGATNIANIVGTKAYNNGGHIAAGQVGMVGEKGLEFVSGPANVFSTQKTKEAFQGGGGSNTKVNVKVMNYGNSKVEVTESGSDREKEILILIDRTKQSIAADAVRGDGVVDKAFSTAFKLGRTA